MDITKKAQIISSKAKEMISPEKKAAFLALKKPIQSKIQFDLKVKFKNEINVLKPPKKLEDIIELQKVRDSSLEEEKHISQLSQFYEITKEAYLLPCILKSLGYGNNADITTKL